MIRVVHYWLIFVVVVAFVFCFIRKINFSRGVSKSSFNTKWSSFHNWMDLMQSCGLGHINLSSPAGIFPPDRSRVRKLSHNGKSKSRLKNNWGQTWDFITYYVFLCFIPDLAVPQRQQMLCPRPLPSASPLRYSLLCKYLTSTVEHLKTT